MPVNGISYAVVFKTHFWDGFTERQLRRLIARSPGGDVFVVLDETHGSITQIPSFPADRVIRITEQQAVRRGFPYAKTDNSLFWYNIDYPHYLFFDGHDQYDYYLTIEYDVSVNMNVDSLIGLANGRRVDYVGFPILKPKREWPWYEKHLSVYEEQEIFLALSCIAVFSNRAMQLLLTRRLEQAKQFEKGELTFWPNNEAFIPTEIRRAGMHSQSILDFGSASRYDWWPPTHENLVSATGETFLHPVLEGTRYIRSVFRHEPHLMTLLSSSSKVRLRLTGIPMKQWSRLFMEELRRRSTAAVQRRLAKVGLAKPWTADAERSEVTHPAH